MSENKSTNKQKKDLKIAEIIYYSIGGLCLLVGVVFSIFSLILLNPTKQNFEDTFLKQFETNLFKFLNWDSNFSSAGLLLMIIAVVYFAIVFILLTKKADKIDKITSSKKTRQRQVVFTQVAPVEDKTENSTNQ